MSSTAEGDVQRDQALKYNKKGATLAIGSLFFALNLHNSKKSSTFVPHKCQNHTALFNRFNKGRVLDTRLQTYIEQAILPQYDAFDGGHQRDHALMVIDESLKLAREHGADEQMAYVIAAYHDLGLRYDREHHHLHSGEMLMADETLRQWFTPEQLLIMRDAVEDHRASSHHPPRTLYGAIVAEADRQIDPILVVHRTMAYSARLYPEGDFETLYARSKEHLLEKYAEGGYMHLWLNSERNVRSLKELRAIIRDEAQLRALCLNYFQQTHTPS